MKTILALAAALSTASIALTVGPAAAEPPVNHDDSGHVHHVWLGNGECHQIDSVTWDPTGRGMHRGANSSGPERGPWHGPCPG